MGTSDRPPATQPIDTLTLYALRVNATGDIINPVPSITLTFPATIPPYYRAPFNIPQPDKAGGVSSPSISLAEGRTRFWNAVYRNGSVWMVQTVGDGPNATRSLVRWYEVQTNGWEGSGAPGTPTIRQWGIIDPAARCGISQMSGFVPVIAVDAVNNAAVAFNTAAPSAEGTPDNNRFVGIRRVSRCAEEALNQMPASSVLYQSNTVLDIGFSTVGGGDFSGLVPDSNVPNRFYSHSWAPQANASGPLFPNRAITRVIRFDGQCGLDMNGDGALDGLDGLSFMNSFILCEPEADLVIDGTVNAIDAATYPAMANPQP